MYLFKQLSSDIITSVVFVSDLWSRETQKLAFPSMKNRQAHAWPCGSSDDKVWSWAVILIFI